MGKQGPRKREEIHQTLKDRRGRSFLIDEGSKLEENGLALLFHLLRGGEGDASGVASFGGDDHLSGPFEYRGIPLHNGIVISLAGSGDLLLEIRVLLHAIGKGLVSFEIRIVLESDVDFVRDVLEFALELIAVGIAHVARTVLGDLGEGRLIKIDALIEELGGILQYHNALSLIVINGRSIVLNLLLKLLEIASGFDFHHRENDARDNGEAPKNDLEKGALPIGFYGHLFLDDVDIAPLLIDRASHFV